MTLYTSHNIWLHVRALAALPNSTAVSLTAYSCVVVVDELPLGNFGHQARFPHVAIPYYDHLLRVLVHQKLLLSSSWSFTF